MLHATPASAGGNVKHLQLLPDPRQLNTDHMLLSDAAPKIGEDLSLER
jgi:hypothetical protein